MLYIYRCVMWRCVYGMRLCVNNTVMWRVFVRVDVQKKLSAAKITRKVMVMNVSHINIFKAPNLFLLGNIFNLYPQFLYHVFNVRPPKSNYHMLYPFLPENLFPSPFQGLFVLEGNPDNNLGQIPQTPISDIQ